MLNLLKGYYQWFVFLKEAHFQHNKYHSDVDPIYLFNLLFIICF